MRVIQSNSAVESKAMLGLPSTERHLIYEGKGHMRQREYAHGVWTRQRTAQRERRAMRGMGRRELALVLASESLQYKEGRGGKDR